MYEAQREEAIKRLKLLENKGLHENVLKEFKEESLIYKSEKTGILYWLNEEEKDLVDVWEKETGNLVYHIIKSYTGFGDMLSIFYISKYIEEWELDIEDLNSNYALTYVKNLDDDYLSEYGTIAFDTRIGGLIRKF